LNPIRAIDMRSSLMFLSGLFFLLSANELFAQSKKAVKWYAEAKSYRAQEDYPRAIATIEKALKASPDYIDALIMAGQLYHMNGQVDSALAKYRRALRYQAPYYVYYYYGKLLFLQEQYQQCKAPLEQYLKSPKAQGKYRAEVENILRSAAFAEKAIQNPKPYAPENLGEAVNSPALEYFPALSADGNFLVFTFRDPQSERQSDEDFYFTYRDSAGAPWQKAQPLKGYLNTASNEGAQSVTADGQVLFFAACNRPDGAGSCDIYASFREPDGSWSKATNLGGAINSRMWESQPSISPDGRTLYFVRAASDQSDDMDIFYSHFVPGQGWTQAEPVAGEVNTPFKDVSPFMHFDGRSLYFSSNGHPGLGDLDFFVARLLPDGSFDTPENLGYPINSARQDFSLRVAPDGRTGYFARDGEEGYGGLDLYTFTLPEDVSAQKVAYVKGRVVNANTREAIAGAPLLFSALDTNGQDLTRASDNQGYFYAVLPAFQDYALSVKKKGYLYYSRNFSLLNQALDDAYELLVELVPIEIGARVKLDNVFFAFDSFDLLPRSYVELNKVAQFLKDNPNLEVELAGHTDNEGSAAYNETLSHKRARAVQEYLLTQGIAASRLTYRGYGAQRPIATNDTEQGRARNRRTELIIKKTQL